jgi:hypothetical protein
VKVEGLTHDNFKTSYLYIVNDLNISEFVDKNAIKASQFNVLSYDYNIFINKNAVCYDVNIFNKTDTTHIVQKEKVLLPKTDTTHIVRSTKEVFQKEKLTQHILRLKERDIGGCVSFLKLKFKNELETYNEDCIYIPNGKEFYECFIPFTKLGTIRKLKSGERHKVLSMYTNNLLCLNPTITLKQAIVTLVAVAAKTCIEAVPNKDIEEIVKYKYKELESGNLKPVSVKLKKYWVDPSTDDKFDKYNKKRKEYVLNALMEFFGDEICNTDDKVTYKYIANKIGVCERTIHRNLTIEYKTIIKEHNNYRKKTI